MGSMRRGAAPRSPISRTLRNTSSRADALGETSMRQLPGTTERRLEGESFCMSSPQKVSHIFFK
jgi:hypothetical protein